MLRLLPQQLPLGYLFAAQPLTLSLPSVSRAQLRSQRLQLPLGRPNLPHRRLPWPQLSLPLFELQTQPFAVASNKGQVHLTETVIVRLCGLRVMFDTWNGRGPCAQDAVSPVRAAQQLQILVAP